MPKILAKDRKFQNLVGLRFGTLTVKSLSGHRKGNYYWNCQCDCGRTQEIQRSSLKNINPACRECKQLRNKSKTNRGESLCIEKYPKIPTQEAFEKLFVTDPSTGCWIWIGRIFKPKDPQQRYGIIWSQRHQKRLYAHRVAWMIYRGDLPQHLNVCHHCDNPSCVNPSHLFLGTQAENLQDMFRKKRGAVGPKASMAKLTWEQVDKIRSDKRKGIIIAREMGIEAAIIYGVKSGRTYKPIFHP